MCSDETICLLIRRKEKNGLEYLYKKYYRPLVVWADTFMHDMGAAENLVQDFFIKLWEKEILGNIQPCNLKNYLYTGVRNRALNSLNKFDPLRRVGEVVLPALVWEEYDDFEDQVVEKVREAVERLPERSREVVKGVYLENLKYKEVAEKYGISIATVKTLLVNSLKSLRKELAVYNGIFFIYLIKKIKKSFNRF
ncbi:MAG: sigma-70 family RNA polymerase sigma factor [Odoribacter sp.]|nr:sigma-70 family RNA polymerase sigma factor [Odoribacter sp.]